MSKITDIIQFKREIQRCRELAIPRKLGYTYHVFVGEVDYDGCDLYHITFALLPAFKLNFPGKIKKVRLNYATYEKCTEIHKIFDFYNGDVVIIVDRNDYPNDRESEKVCIERIRWTCLFDALTQGIDINNVAHQFYDTNPYTSGATSPSQKALKVRICGLPLSVVDSAVHELLGKLDVKLTIRCGDLDSANAIPKADDALAALRLGKKVKSNDQWVSTKVSVMEEILENKCVQVPVFRDKFVTSKQSTTFVEATYNNKWGSGLDRDGTRNTKPDHWPGKNVLGVLMEKNCKKRKHSDSRKIDRKQKQNKDQPNQRTIKQMLEQLGAMSDSDVSGV
uniref:Uncharacterized protein n=1 Tax=Magallana gigas TaxID=29159 RepID=K1Q7I4_MAGGI